MLLKKLYFVDSPEEKKDNLSADIPEDDGHQMSQSEIDNLIAMLLNNQ